jgi:hypothetical protein
MLFMVAKNKAQESAGWNRGQPASFQGRCRAVEGVKGRAVEAFTQVEDSRAAPVQPLRARAGVTIQAAQRSPIR